VASRAVRASYSSRRTASNSPWRADRRDGRDDDDGARGGAAAGPAVRATRADSSRDAGFVDLSNGSTPPFSESLARSSFLEQM